MITTAGTFECFGSGGQWLTHYYSEAASVNIEAVRDLDQI